MTTLTIRDLPDDDAARLRDRALTNRRSVEDEARVILHEVLHETASSTPDNAETPQKGLGTAISERWREIGGVELELPPRNEYPRDPFGGTV